MASANTVQVFARRLAAASAAGVIMSVIGGPIRQAPGGDSPGYCMYCENAHADDLHKKDCDDEAGIIDAFRNWHEAYHRHRRDKRRHLYYKAQNAHYDLYYPPCPPHWSDTFGYHTTQWRVFPESCNWQYPIAPPGLTTTVPLYSVPATGASPIAPDVPPATTEPLEPYFPSPASDTPPSPTPPSPQPRDERSPESNAAPVEILLMSGNRFRTKADTRITSPRLYAPVTAFDEDDATAGEWLPSIVH